MEDVNTFIFVRDKGRYTYNLIKPSYIIKDSKNTEVLTLLEGDKALINFGAVLMRDHGVDYDIVTLQDSINYIQKQKNLKLITL